MTQSNSFIKDCKDKFVSRKLVCMILIYLLFFNKYTYAEQICSEKLVKNFSIDIKNTYHPTLLGNLMAYVVLFSMCKSISLFVCLTMYTTIQIIVYVCVNTLTDKLQRSKISVWPPHAQCRREPELKKKI